MRRKSSRAAGPADTAAAAGWATAPRVVVLGAVAWLILAWLLLVLSDGLDVFGWRERLREPLWQTLFFNRRPTEWLQWLALAAAYGAAMYVAAAVRERPGLDGLSRFLLWFGAGAALMLIEDAGDPRHITALYVRRLLDDALVLGLHPATLVDIPYFTLLALPLLYALVRHGGAVWRIRQIRPYVLGAYGLYGLAAVGSALSGVGGGRHEASVYLGSLYERMGDVLVRVLPGGEALGQGMEPAHFRFQMMDSPVEESVELLGAACMLALVLACARHARVRLWRGPHERATTEIPRAVSHW